jgi:endo-1,4-beta-xylanase
MACCLITHFNQRHVQTVASHYRGQIYSWDVVNEAFNEDGTYRESIWYTTFGEDYIEWAFRWAQEADPVGALKIPWLIQLTISSSTP